jgi:hypothetical protein
LPLLNANTPAGHAGRQAPHPVQAFWSTTTRAEDAEPGLPEPAEPVLLPDVPDEDESLAEAWSSP